MKIRNSNQKSESKKAISWFQFNKMIVNPGKFQGIIIDSIIIDKKEQNHTAEYISIDQKKCKNFIISKTFRSAYRR